MKRFLLFTLCVVMLLTQTASGAWIGQWASADHEIVDVSESSDSACSEHRAHHPEPISDDHDCCEEHTISSSQGCCEGACEVCALDISSASVLTTHIHSIDITLALAMFSDLVSTPIPRQPDIYIPPITE